MKGSSFFFFFFCREGAAGDAFLFGGITFKHMQPESLLDHWVIEGRAECIWEGSGQKRQREGESNARLQHEHLLLWGALASWTRFPCNRTTLRTSLPYHMTPPVFHLTL